MNVGILNFHFCDNFGAVLQCAALQQVIADLGHRVEVIDYRSQGEKKISWIRGWGVRKPSLAKIKSNFKRIYFGRRMMRNFEQFRGVYLNRTEPVFNESELGAIFAGYDAIVVGSDQVWNLSYGFVGPAYFLAEKFGNGFKRISYAACSGHKDMPAERMTGVAACLRAFDAVSVRNQFSYEWVNEVSGLEPEVVCDPTLLVSFDTKKTKKAVPLEKYILMYVLREAVPGSEVEVLKKIKEKYGDLPVVAVAATSFIFQEYPNADYVVWDAGPLEWVSLIMHASCLYTDSFHGVMFALKNNVPFLSYYSHPMQVGRLIDTAQRFGVMGRVISHSDQVETEHVLETPIDYVGVSEKMGALIATSKKFLQEALRDA